MMARTVDSRSTATSQAGGWMDELIARLRARAADPKRRTDAPQSVSISGPGGTLTTTFGRLPGAAAERAGAWSLGGLLSDLQHVVAANQAARPIDAEVRARADALASSFTPENERELPSAASEAILARAEARLGFALPTSLRRLYAEVANGGFGPGGGLLAIDDAVEAYVGFRRESPGPRGQRWPERLLPLVADEPGYACLDVESGRIVSWDPEGLGERSGEKAWARSFTDTAESLEAWLSGWVDSRPPHELLEERLNAARVEQAREARARLAAKTPEERRAMGLPDVGWERVVWGGIGLDEDEGPRTSE